MPVLSERCILVLQAATEVACAEALKAAPPSELWTHVLAVVNPVIRAQVQKHMARLTCIARLPDELLLVIFDYLSVWDRVRAATVCYHWRTVSLNAVSALWSDIPHLRNVHTYERLLSRARDFPITLTYRPEYLEHLESFCDTVSRHLPRLKGLRIILPEWVDDADSRNAAEYLNAILCGNAPILESVVLSDPGEINGRLYTHLPLLTSPLLRTIELDGFDLRCLEACIDSPTVNTLSVTTTDSYNAIHPKDWSRLARLPAMEALSLRLLDVYAVDIPAHSPPLPRCLQHLSLQVDPQVLDALAKLDDFSRFRTLHITFLHRVAEVRQVAELLPSLSDTTISAAVHFLTACFCLQAADRSDRKRVFRHIKLDDDWHTLIPNVTRLWLDAYRAKSQPQVTPARFPALEVLTLDATSVMPSPSVATAPRPLVWPSLLCPRLRTVRFISENARPPLDTGEVLDYLRRTLEFCSPPLCRLESLVFDGITLNSQPDLDLPAALDAVTDNVEMEHSGEVPQESYRAWPSLSRAHSARASDRDPEIYD